MGHSTGDCPLKIFGRWIIWPTYIFGLQIGNSIYSGLEKDTKAGRPVTRLQITAATMESGLKWGQREREGGGGSDAWDLEATEFIRKGQERLLAWRTKEYSGKARSTVWFLRGCLRRLWDAQWRHSAGSWRQILRRGQGHSRGVLPLYLWECGNPHKERKGSGQKAANASF